jgi:hypothetical protein
VGAAERAFEEIEQRVDRLAGTMETTDTGGRRD